MANPDCKLAGAGNQELPAGVSLKPLTPHPDDRGVFLELFREEWRSGVAPVQWNAVRSAPGVLRGVHVHARHDDYLVLYAGRASIGLCDLRRGSPTERLSALVPMQGDAPTALTVPHGVAHGFYFHEPSIHIYAVSHYWDPADELGCLWADKDLGIPWPVESAHVSPRDASLPSLEELLSRVDLTYAEPPAMSTVR
jgi:dTDP-4-dehydrorhamnose 3,5-epimerase